MEALDQTRRVIELMERDLADVDYTRIARLTGIPLGLYQRIFAYICNVSMTGYVRKRRLTLAAEKLLSGSRSVTEIALESGYDSSSSFSRAFKEQFSVAPAALTRAIYEDKAFFPISFEDKDSYYVLEGRRMMADLVKIEYEEQPELLLIGISNRDYGVSTHRLWDVFWERGFDKKLYELAEHQVEMEDCMGLGYMTDFTSDTGLGDTYIIGKHFKPGTPVPEGMTGRIIPGGTVAKARIAAAHLDDIINNAYILISHMAQKNGYTVAYDGFYWTEWYSISRFCEPLERGERVVLDWQMPVKRA